VERRVKSKKVKGKSKKWVIMDNKEIIVEVTEEQYNRQLADGLLKDEILSVGKHTFKRGGFHKRHPKFKAKETKTRAK
jgi:hypothetical protein